MATISSAPSTTVTVSPVNTSWWLRDPISPALNRRVYVQSDALDLVSDEPREVLRPLGRSTAVVVSDGVLHSPEFSVEFACPTAADVSGLRALREGLRTLLLVSPYGHSLYVRLGRERHRARLMGGRTVDVMEYDAVVVDVP